MIKEKKLYRLIKSFRLLRNIIWIVIIFLPLTIYSQQTSPHFICPPCNASCDTLKFDSAGVCPVCKMALLDREAFSKDVIFKPFSAQALKEDFKVFRTALEKSHPGIYWHTPKTIMDQAFDRAYSGIKGPMNILEYSRLIFPVVYKIGCGHTFINLPNSTTSYLLQEGRFFPFDIIFKGNKAYVYSNNSQHSSILPGSEILQINNQSVKKIKEQLFAFISTDNNTATGKYKVLNANFVEFYKYFIGDADTFHLRLRDQHPVKVAALSKSDIAKNRVSNSANNKKMVTPIQGSSDKILSFNVLSSRATAILKIKNFIDPLITAEGYKFETYIDSAFNQIKEQGIKNLIIDIRGNPGGSNGNAAYLFSYLTDKPFRVDQYWEVKTLPLPYVDFSAIRDSEGKPIELKEEDFIKVSEDRYRKKYYPSYDTIHPKNNTFKGSVYVIIDGWVGSEAASFASLVSHNKRGVFIGEETGGSYNGCTAGLLGKTVLPNTKLDMTIPVFKIVRFTDAGNEHKGIRPDDMVEPSMSDLFNGVDRELIFILNKI